MIAQNNIKSSKLNNDSEINLNNYNWNILNLLKKFFD